MIIIYTIKTKTKTLTIIIIIIVDITYIIKMIIIIMTANGLTMMSIVLIITD